jgi:hypothetical protein
MHALLMSSVFDRNCVCEHLIQLNEECEVKKQNVSYDEHLERCKCKSQQQKLNLILKGYSSKSNVNLFL